MSAIIDTNTVWFILFIIIDIVFMIKRIPIVAIPIGLFLTLLPLIMFITSDINILMVVFACVMGIMVFVVNCIDYYGK